jgi:AcrR family transcriptional regulator
VPTATHDYARKRPTQARAQVTVDAILRATAHILKTEGYEGCSTNAIAKKAGVSIGSLYQYFPSKEALVVALAEEHARHGYELLLESIRVAGDAPKTVEDLIRHYIRAMVQMHTDDAELHRVLIEQVGSIHAGRQVMRQMSNQSAALVQAWLSANREHFRELDPEIATYVLVTCVESVTHLRLLDRPDRLGAEQLIDELSELVLRYLDVKRSKTRRR